MPSEASLFACLPPSSETNPDTLLTGFLRYAEEAGLSLYPHQEEAILSVLDDKNVILHTPTGSGKSLVATAVHFRAVAEGRRSFYTSPIKALVSEKFFTLCRELGPDHVGMMTGDATVNRGAPVICCTAEVLANVALAEGAQADVAYVVMDEFHYFSDRERGSAWQIPLLTLPQARFLLMSATLGDVSVFERTLTEQTGVETITVRSTERPVPLSFEYQEKLLLEAIQTLVSTGRAPVYVVNFTQRGAAEVAQSLLSTDFCTKDEKKIIAQAVAGESFRSPYGRDVQRLVRHGIGIHHAGLLPRYRLLVEKLAQQGLLKVICGTDTLGVGVNVPIRTVLFTKLCKYDGDKVRILSARDFHQVAGRAGRRGYDVQGFVVALAPEHVVENRRIEAKAQSGKMKKKAVKRKAPEWGYVPWDKATFEKLVAAEPEPLVSRFKVTHAMLLHVLGRPEGGCRAMKKLIGDCLETARQKKEHRRRAIELLRSLWQAGIIEFRSASEGGGVRVDAELQDDFSLFHGLGLFIVDAVERLDKESPDYALTVISLVESVLEDPEVILRRQVDKLKGELVAALKAEGVEYEERMAELEKVEHPKPAAEFLYESYAAFAKDQPWVSRESIRPKSIAREMLENFLSFGGYIKQYGLARSEGLLLRYLSDFYKTLTQTLPEGARTPELEDGIEHFGALVRGVDSSLLDEWERLRNPAALLGGRLELEEAAPGDLTRDPKKLTALVRNLAYSFLRALQNRDFESALDLVEPGLVALSPVELERAFKSLFEEGEIRLDAVGRSPSHTQIEKGDEYWSVTQNIVIAEDISEYGIRARVDLGRTRLERRPILLLDAAGVL